VPTTLEDAGCGQPEARKEPTMPMVLDTFIQGNYFPGRRDETGKQGEPRYVVLHVQDGTNQGSLDWFQQPTTQSSVTVLVSLDGEV